ncbi:Hsp33 family molecular chaperone HslO [Olsenella profusa]|nr:Hsp33 family molecular chaperone HslO [Olsenella profusa]
MGRARRESHLWRAPSPRGGGARLRDLCVRLLRRLSGVAFDRCDDRCSIRTEEADLPAALGAMPAEFFCARGDARAGRAVMALGEAQHRDMIAKREPAEVYHHLCGNRFGFSPNGLATMLG